MITQFSYSSNSIIEIDFTQNNLQAQLKNSFFIFPLHLDFLC